MSNIIERLRSNDDPLSTEAAEEIQSLVQMFGWLYAEASSLAEQGLNIGAVELPDLFARAEEGINHPVINDLRESAENQADHVMEGLSNVKLNVDAEIDDICEREGYSRTIYKDHLGNPTIAQGITWLSEKEGKTVIKGRAPQMLGELVKAFPWLEGDMPIGVAMVLFHMSYWMGMPRLKEWELTLGHLEHRRFAEASIEMLDSAVYRDEATRDRIQSLSWRIKEIGESVEEEKIH